MAGNCHHPKNNHIVLGMLAQLGEDAEVVGAAASGPRLVFYKGESIANAAIGVTIAGAFESGFGMETGSKKDITEVVECAGTATKNAVSTVKSDLLFVFDCSGRFQALSRKKQLGEEFNSIKAVAGSSEIFGFYGQGEVGKKNKASKSFGSGFYISTCALEFK